MRKTISEVPQLRAETSPLPSGGSGILWSDVKSARIAQSKKGGLRIAERYFSLQWSNTQVLDDKIDPPSFHHPPPSVDPNRVFAPFFNKLSYYEIFLN